MKIREIVGRAGRDRKMMWPGKCAKDVPHKNRRIAIHLHIFYKNQTGEMLFYINKLLRTPRVIADLFVTMVDNDESTIKKIQESSGKSNILIVPNKGYDVAPFLHVINKINLDDYDYVLKIHTKNPLSGQLTFPFLPIDGWRSTLLNSLLQDDIINKNLAAMESDEKLGMIGAQSLIVDEEKFSDGCLFGIPQEMARIKFPVPNSMKFIAGTMFLVRSRLLKPIQQAGYTIDDFEESNPLINDNLLAHTLERIFGAMVILQGYKIEGFDWSFKWFFQESLRKLGRFFFTKRTTNNDRKLIKICQLPVYSRQNADVLKIKRSKFFNRTWYLNQYPHIKRSIFSPEFHYLKYGWKRGYNPSDKFNTNDYLAKNPSITGCPLLHYEKTKPSV
ncbi:MAG: rhamnan synthesis F family protein [Holosporaceae bacterium]|nr:rhamnan synthesis F family protein [Holosporaceae bacterium]